jgi:peptidoglycan/xylan/chitin deacetylase (PgdA/CDA1 family)
VTRHVGWLAALLATVVLITSAWPERVSGQTDAAATVPVSPEEVVRGDPSSPRIVLAINVGAGSTPAESMLDTLRERGLRTTFFVLGWLAERIPQILARVAADGHEIASHGHSVFDLTRVSDAAVVADLEAADAAISAVTGRSTRPLWSPSAGYRDARVRALAARLGYRPIYWTVDSGDWQERATADGVYRRVMDQTVNGSIVVLHFDSPTTTTTTAVVLGQIIDDLRAQGFQPGTVTELLTGAPGR